MEREQEEQGDDSPIQATDDSVAEAQELVTSWGDEVEAKGMTDEQWESTLQVRSRDPGHGD